jgi:hypothetical protein
MRHCEFLTAPVKLVKVIKHDITDKHHVESTVTSNLAAPKTSATLVAPMFLGLRKSQYKYYGFGSSIKNDLMKYILNYNSVLKRNLNTTVTLTTRMNSLYQFINKSN